MTATMADGSKNTGEVVIIRASPEHSVTADQAREYRSMKSLFTKKQIIVAVSVVCVVALVIAGIVLGVYFFLDASKDIVTRTYDLKTDDGKTVEEEATADVTDNLVHYHSVNGDSETWAIHDFNRELQIIKSRDETGYYTCYVKPLNVSDTASPAVVYNATKPSGTVRTINDYYSVLPTPIKDTSILGKEGQKMCKGIDTYWVKDSCEKHGDASAADRQKRGAGGWYWCHLNDGGWWCCHRVIANVVVKVYVVAY
jgi:hypothetical protein